MQFHHCGGRAKHPTPGPPPGKRLGPIYHEGFPEGLSVIRIAPISPASPDPPWHCERHGGPIRLEYTILAEAISDKDALVASYQRTLKTVWLLIVISDYPISKFWVPPEITTWKFRFGFEKALVFPQADSKVIELNRECSQSNTMPLTTAGFAVLRMIG